MQCIDAAYCYRCCTCVCVCVCLSVCLSVYWLHWCTVQNTTEPIKMPFGGWLMLAQGTMYYTRFEIPTRLGNFVGCPAHWKSLGVFCGIHSKRDYSMRSSGMMCDAAFRQNSLTTCGRLVSHIVWVLALEGNNAPFLASLALDEGMMRSSLVRVSALSFLLCTDDADWVTGRTCSQ